MVNELEISPSSDQIDVCNRYNVVPRTPEDRVAVALHTLSDSPIYGTRIRDAKSGAISWFLYCGKFSEADDFFQPLHTDHLVEDLPEVVKYLYLPEGANFIIDRSGYEDVWFE
ncbi:MULTISPECIES: hypothetical protein [unclassified Pseudomonas]|uniref:immunity protein Imm33 domain-containing protein n=1 Tax=unclassified Pseudomonas TaxID=196821 RepID=UPI0020973CCA|nr:MULTISPECIES: hypothetical protein [unclassified Pseudomonas]MCO7521977.1 hypothetical protein [Pseudomonas sp. 1]MCO7542517.1 hypothetical protein [Pseudomonas sp. VA159-2]